MTGKAVVKLIRKYFLDSKVMAGHSDLQNVGKAFSIVAFKYQKRARTSKMHQN